MYIDYWAKKLYLHLERYVLNSNSVMSVPSTIKINTGYICNLHCPMCPTGIGTKKKTNQLSFKDLEFLLSKIGSGKNILLFGWGEPFLNKDIFKIIQHVKDRRNYVNVDSNLNLSKAIIENIQQITFDYLSVSLDGIDQESYSRYRYGGNFNLAFENIKKLRDSKRGPQKIEWQYIVSNKNFQFVKEAERIASSLKIPIKFIDMGLYLDVFYNHEQTLSDEWIRKERTRNRSPLGRSIGTGMCHYMYNGPFVDIDGSVYPCCTSVFAPPSVLESGYQNVFGNLHQNSLDEIWNNQYYMFMRSRFSGKAYNGAPCKPICLNCKVYLCSKGMDTDHLPYFKPSTVGTC